MLGLYELWFLGDWDVDLVDWTQARRLTGRDRRLRCRPRRLRGRWSATGTSTSGTGRSTGSVALSAGSGSASTGSSAIATLSAIATSTGLCDLFERNQCQVGLILEVAGPMDLDHVLMLRRPDAAAECESVPRIDRAGVVDLPSFPLEGAAEPSQAIFAGGRPRRLAASAHPEELLGAAGDAPRRLSSVDGGELAVESVAAIADLAFDQVVVDLWEDPHWWQYAASGARFSEHARNLAAPAPAASRDFTSFGSSFTDHLMLASRESAVKSGMAGGSLEPVLRQARGARRIAPSVAHGERGPGCRSKLVCWQWWVPRSSWRDRRLPAA